MLSVGHTKMAFGFRLRFLAPPGTSLEPESFELALPGAKDALVVRQQEPKANALPTDPVVITINGDGFDDRDAAQAFGQDLRDSLAVHSVRKRRGFWLGDDLITSSLGATVRDKIRQEHCVEVRPTVHGLDVYETAMSVSHFEMSARASVLRPIRNLGPDLAADFQHWSLPAKLLLAVELYNESHFIPQAETRFLALVTVVEVLVDRTPVAPDAVAFLDKCLDSLPGLGLGDGLVQSLRSGLKSLKTQSIGSACVAAAEAAGCDASLMRRCYQARSEMLHSGESRTNPELPRQPHLLDELVHNMLLYRLRDGQHGAAADDRSQGGDRG